MKRDRTKVIQFIKSEYQKIGKTPSIREICKAVGLTIKALYEVFPGGMPDMCAAAGVPEDKTRRVSLEKANRALKEKRTKAESDGRLRCLKEKEKKIAAEAKRAQSIENANRNIVEGEFKLASSLEGIKNIFSDPERMLEFAACTVAREGLMLNDSDVWDSLVSYCRNRGLDLAKKLFQIVGPLEDFEAETEETELHRYIGLRIKVFLMNCEELQKHRMMQAGFEGLMRDSRCSFCGRRATAAFMQDGKLYCPCGHTFWQLWCPNCQEVIQFETEKDAFYCYHCKLSYKLPRHAGL
jgi:hypothetical protein